MQNQKSTPVLLATCHSNPKPWGTQFLHAMQMVRFSISLMESHRPNSNTWPIPSSMTNLKLSTSLMITQHITESSFKGMAQILKEHGYLNVNTLKAQCLNFKCQSINNNCCYHNILFHSADFINIPCLLMTHCRAAGIDILFLFLPKVHCELNF